MDMNQTTLLRRDENGVSLLTINRTDRLNALDYATIDRLLAALDEIAADRSLRVVILTGAGERAFSAGADIFGLASSLARGVDVAVREFVERGQRLTARIEAFPKPVIVAVNGLAYGAGCEIAEAAPLTLASERASFAKPEIDLGFPPPFGGTQRLPRLVGRKRALAMILTGEPIPAARAAEIGLVNQVVPHEQLLPEALRLASVIRGKSPGAVAAALAAVTRGLDTTVAEGLAIEASQFSMMALTPDVDAGLRRFADRRRRAHERLPFQGA
ncbi:Enoyl-CoA hydratase/carnithine racemase [Tistlia consotensis]|uniref:Enoyl-CoA hydratase/carnithine racemase n=1 Tax=Tistlia consotensis USBA 355 TaxID=560819 RepID=A0A1Y6CDE1_9PROT|nr:crotonase/enoyl-CoA hydratase family protein [Tistlia consotensis]SMF55740.1 Enoyl-CoA hydratase/carnithine racemase [Tistlia consotensis USBA 355]SNR89130.1 Enoyl-CoA hydratase/carnithine racemase [Tistlia consotensis]